MAQYYLVVRRRTNGREDEITRYGTVDLTDDQIRTLRETAFGTSRAAKIANNWHVIVYGPNEDDLPHSLSDRIWDSETDL